MDQGLKAGSTMRVASGSALGAYLIAAIFVLTQGLLRGFMALLRDIFVAVGLPFAILFGMAGWQERLRALGDVSRGLAGAAGVSSWLLMPIIVACVALIAARISDGALKRVMFGLSGLCALDTAIKGGAFLAVVMTPGIIVSALGLARDDRLRL